MMVDLAALAAALAVLALSIAFSIRTDPALAALETWDGERAERNTSVLRLVARAATIPLQQFLRLNGGVERCPKRLA